MTKKIIIYAVILIALVGASILLIMNSSQPSSGNTVEQPNNNAPTQEEQAAGDKIKEGLGENKGGVSNPVSPGPTDTSVVITSALQDGNAIDITSYVRHYEDGSCKFTLTKDGQTVTRSTPAYRDSTITICTNPLIEKVAFSSGGQWTLSILYSNTSGSVTKQSANSTVDVTL